MSKRRGMGVSARVLPTCSGAIDTQPWVAKYRMRKKLVAGKPRSPWEYTCTG